MRLLLALVIGVSLWIPDGADEGREGNELFRQGQYTEAVTVYRQGLARMTADPSPVRAALYNNLGAAQYQLENYAEATRAFSDGLEVTTTTEGQTRLAYNAGNSNFREEKLEEALAYYRQTLLTNPDYENAKFNYEFVKRRLEEQREQQQQSQNNQNNEQQEQQDQNQQNNQQQQNQQQNQNNQQGQQNQQNQQNQQDQQNQQRQQSQQDDQNQQQNQQQSNNNGSNDQSNPSSSSQGSQQQSDQNGRQKLSEEEAMRILQALQDSEENLLRRMPTQQEPQDRNVEKDW